MGKRKTSWALLILFTLSIIFLSGCDRGPQKKTDPLDIISLQAEEEIKNEGILLLEYSAKYPQIKEAGNDPCLIKINDFYKGKFNEMNEKTLFEAKKMASEDFLAAKEGEYEFRPHGLGNTYEVTYNDKGLLSINLLEYTYWGGAHPNSFKESAIFDINTGQKVTLEKLFKVDKDKAIGIVLTEVRKQIEEKGSEELFLYEDALESLPDSFFEEDFYYDGKDIVFYFQQYVIAPYAAGFPEFRIPVKDIPYFQ